VALHTLHFWIRIPKVATAILRIQSSIHCNTMASTSTADLIYSRKVIPRQEFKNDVRDVKPVSGYYIFFKADLDDDLEEKSNLRH